MWVILDKDCSVILSSSSVNIITLSISSVRYSLHIVIPDWCIINIFLLDNMKLYGYLNFRNDFIFVIKKSK